MHLCAPVHLAGRGSYPQRDLQLAMLRHDWPTVHLAPTGGRSAFSFANRRGLHPARRDCSDPSIRR